MIVLVTSKPFPTAVILRWFSFLFISLFLGNSVDGTDIQKDDAATAESNDEIIGYADRIRAYVNITYTDPVTGKQKSEKSLKGKWGTNGRMEQVAAPAHIAVYGNKTDGCKKLTSLCRRVNGLRSSSAVNAAFRRRSAMPSTRTPRPSSSTTTNPARCHFLCITMWKMRLRFS